MVSHTMNKDDHKYHDQGVAKNFARKSTTSNRGLQVVETNLRTKVMDKRNQGHESKVAIDLSLHLPELMHHAPPHRQQVQVALVLATLHQLQRFLQCLFEPIQRFPCGRQVSHVRRFQSLQKVPYHPHLLRQSLAVPPVRPGVVRGGDHRVRQARGAQPCRLSHALHHVA